MRKSCVLILAASLVAAGAALAAAEFAPDLSRYLARSGNDDFIPVSIALDGGIAPAALEDMTAGLSRDAARALVGDVAKRRAEEVQAPFRKLFRTAQERGMARDVKFIWAANVVAAEVKPPLLARIAGMKGVRRINLEKPADVICGLAWGVEKIGADRVWNELGVTGEGVVVAVTDTGVDYLHTDLVNRAWVNEGEIPDNGIDDDDNGFIDDYHGWNFNEDNNDPRGGTNGHGTHCSGSVCGDGAAGTQTGVAPGAKVMPVQVLTDGGSGVQSDCWDGLQYAFDNGADVTSMSLGWRQNQNPDRATWRSTMETLMAGGMVYSIAAGNERNQYPPPNDIRTPGDVPAVITVGGTDANDALYNSSSYGPVTWSEVPPWNDYPYPPGLTKPDVAGPAVNVTSCRGITGGYSVMTGTSMATPHVAGLAALMLSVNPDLTNAQVRQYMEDNALDLGTPGKDNDFGSGRVQAYETVSILMGTPVTLNSFTARAAGEAVTVKWTTSNESMLAGFNLYRRPAGVNRSAATAGASRKLYHKLNGDLIQGRSPYVFHDDDVELGQGYEYLLEDVDLSGRTHTYGPAVVRLNGNAKPTSFWLAACAPNPARERAVVKFGLAEGFAGRTMVEVYDLSGRKVATPLDGNLGAGVHEVEVNTSALAPGVYLYRITAGDYHAAKRMVVAH